MARTALTPVLLPEAFAKVPATLPFVAGDPVNFNNVPATGREIVICQNTDGANPHTFTVKSVTLNNRTGDLTVSVPASGFVVTQVFPTEGWAQTDGKLNIDVDDAQLELAVVKLR